MVEDFLSRNARAIRSFLAARSGPLVLRRTTVEDLFQETVALAVRNGKSMRFENDVHFRCWVFTIARRAINMVLTEHGRSPKAMRIRYGQSSGLGVRESELISPRRSPSSSAAGHEDMSRLREALARLLPEQRRIIQLYTLRGLKMPDVARRLGKSDSAAFMQLARAMGKLRDAMI